MLQSLLQLNLLDQCWLHVRTTSYIPSSETHGKSIVRGCKKALVDQYFSDPSTLPDVLKKIGRVLKEEMKVMCSEKTASILCSGDYHTSKTFRWRALLEEMNVHAPMLAYVLKSCTGKSINKNAVIGACASILLRHRCSRMSLLQKFIMLILHAGHCGKQVTC